MSDIDMEIDDNTPGGRPTGFDHGTGMLAFNEQNMKGDSMDEPSEAEEETVNEEEDEKDPEALVEIDPTAILPVKTRPDAGKVDYASEEAHRKAGLTLGEPDNDENDPDYVQKEEEGTEAETEAETEGEDISMQQ